MRLNTLKPNKGAKHRKKRVGCGESSGRGKTSGRGNKGQKARTSGGTREGFEGGQMPIFRRLPKKGFNNAQFRKVYAVVNVSTLEDRFADGAVVSEATLREAGIVNGRYDGVKILGNGEVSRKLTIEGAKVSATAREKIEKAGGTITAAAADEA